MMSLLLWKLSRFKSDLRDRDDHETKRGVSRPFLVEKYFANLRNVVLIMVDRRAENFRRYINYVHLLATPLDVMLSLATVSMV